MASSLNLKLQSLCVFAYVLQFMQITVTCYQVKVGDLDSWGVPTSANRHIYTNWSKKHHFQIGDSLLFLYPPSQDSVIQVTEQAFKTCNISDRILYMDDGNSVFNLTAPGKYYFTSGVAGHCQKSQKLEITVTSADGVFSPASAPNVLPETSPSYPTVFGLMPSLSPPLQRFAGSMAMAAASALSSVFLLVWF